MTKGKRSGGKRVLAAVCITSGRELWINQHDDAREALKRKRWSNVTGDRPPFRAISPSARKRGL